MVTVVVDAGGFGFGGEGASNAIDKMSLIGGVGWTLCKLRRGKGRWMEIRVKRSEFINKFQSQWIDRVVWFKETLGCSTQQNRAKHVLHFFQTKKSGTRKKARSRVRACEGPAKALQKPCEGSAKALRRPCEEDSSIYRFDCVKLFFSEQLLISICFTTDQVWRSNA